jgi:hypothetical protein
MTTTVGKIYGENCIHCINMANAWNKMKKHVLKAGGVNVREFEATKDAVELEKYKTELKEKYGEDLTHDGVPTLFKVGGNGKIEYYNGERTEEALTKWALKDKKVKGGRKTGKNRKIKKTGKKRTKKRCCGFL